MVDCGLDYEKVMKMTPNQLLATAIGDNSDPPDSLRIPTIREISRSVEEVKTALGYGDVRGNQ